MLEQNRNISGFGKHSDIGLQLEISPPDTEQPRRVAQETIPRSFAHIVSHQQTKSVISQISAKISANSLSIFGFQIHV
jgi:hypothetical protein